MDLKEKVLTILGVADGPMQPDLLALLVSKDKQGELNGAIVQLALAGKISVTTEGISLISTDALSTKVDYESVETEAPEDKATNRDDTVPGSEIVPCVQDGPASTERQSPEQKMPVARTEAEPERPWPEFADDKLLGDSSERFCPELLRPDFEKAPNGSDELLALKDASAVREPVDKGGLLLHALSSVDMLPCRKNSITKVKQAGVETIADLVSLSSRLDVSGHVKAVLAEAAGECAVDLPLLRNGEQVAALQGLSGSDKFVFDPLGFLAKAPNLKDEFVSVDVLSVGGVENDVYLSDILDHEPTLKRLRGAKILTVAEFEAKSHDELLDIRGFGSKKLQTVVDAIESWREVGGVVRRTAGPMTVSDFLANYSAEDIAAIESAYVLLDPDGRLVNRESFAIAMLPYAKDGIDAILDAFRKEIATEDRLRAFMGVLSQNSASREAMLSGEILIPNMPEWIDAANDAAEENGWDFDVDTRTFGLHVFGLGEWIDSIDSRAASILRARFSGSTLDEVGKQFGMTRERVRQIVNRELGRRPAILEDRYAYFVATYTMSEDEFCNVTGLPPIAFGYLMETAKTKKADRKLLSDAIEDMLIDRDLKDALSSADLEGFVIIDGAQVPLKRYDITLRLVELRTAEGPMSFDDLLAAFTEVLDGADVPFNAAIRPDSPRAYSAWLGRQDGIIFAPVPKAFDSQERCIRLFSYDKDFSLLEAALDAFPHKHVACTSGLLFENDAFRNACEVLDIRNMYELHQLLRRYCSDYPGLELGKSPSLTLGDATHMEQMRLLIGEMGPVSGHDLAVEYASRYAMDTFSVEMNQLKEVSSYLSDGMYSFGAESLSNDQMSALWDILNKDVSLVSDVRAAYKERFPHCAESDVSFPVLLKLGYKLKRDLVVRQGVDTRAFFSSLLDSATTFAEGSGDFPSEYFRDPIFISELNIRLRSYKIVKLNSGAYETVGAAGSITGKFGITAEDLAGFTDGFLEFMQPDVPYTVHSAIAAGFCDPLIERAGIDNLGFPFLENVASIGFVGGRLKRTSLGNVAIFIRCAGAYNVPGFLNYLLLSNNMSTAEELKPLLEEKYGIDVTCAALRVHMARIDARSEEGEE